MMMKRAEKGKVYLVGAGPGDPDLLTVRAADLLLTADFIFHDDLVAPEILELAHEGATVSNVGKRCGNKTITQEDINRLLVTHGSAGHSVVRLKTGDPMLFGRAGEEMEALSAAGIPYEAVPGITAGFAGASSIASSLTDRRLASKVIFLTGHRAGTEPPHWGSLPTDATLIIYMPGSDYIRLATQILEAGFSQDTPCVIVSNVATKQEKVERTTVAKLPHTSPLPAPCIVLVGEALTS
ncbi:MAG TPA: uroporphyrinogen-III C-methyltransferase [Alloacidobacterium sp.]|nr:uroporphyrinogen-III C-methyltransferase [Alloacidobacterium sp.]